MGIRGLIFKKKNKEVKPIAGVTYNKVHYNTVDRVKPTYSNVKRSK